MSNSITGLFYPPGLYHGRVLGQYFNEAQTGTPQFCLKISVEGRVDPTNPEGGVIECEQAVRTVRRALTEKTFNFAIEDWRHLGYTGGSLSALDPTDPNHYSFAGIEVKLHCEHVTYNGRTREDWSLFRPNAPEPLDRTKLRELDARFGKKLRSANCDQRAKTDPDATSNGKGSPGEQPPLSDDDDDAPF